MSGVSINGLHARHGPTPVLAGLDLTVPDGALGCVLGPSGCGKSTLLRVIAGFHRPTAGQVIVGDRTLDGPRTHVTAEHRRIGYVPQDGALFPHLNVAGNIGFGLPRRRRRARVRELLELVGLEGLADRHPHQLSGGQQQRVALARALAPRPELLLLDEPFAALDAALRTQLRAEVAATLRQAGATAILVTHDVDEALAVADTIAVLRDGHIAQAGTPYALYHHPTDTHIARTLGEANLLPAELVDGHASTALGTLPLSNADSATTADWIVLRPHQLGLTTTPGPDTIEARVITSRFRGHDHRLELAICHAGPPVRLIAYTDTHNPPGTGQTVHIVIHGTAHALRQPHPGPPNSTNPVAPRPAAPITGVARRSRRPRARSG